MNRRNIILLIARMVLLPIPFLPVLFALIINWQEQALHRYMKKELNKQELVTVIAAKQEITWMEYGKELVLQNGQAFDVKHFSIRDNYYILTGLYDEKESIIAKQQAEQGEENTAGNKISNPLPGITDVFFEHKDPLGIIRLPGTEFFIACSVPLSLRIKAVTTPPPRNLFAEV